MKISKVIVLITVLIMAFALAAPVSATNINNNLTRCEPITDMSVTIDGFTEAIGGEPMPFDDSKIKVKESQFYSAEYYHSWSDQEGYYVSDNNPVFKANRTYRLSILFIPQMGYTVEDPEQCDVTILGKKATYDPECKPKDTACFYYYIELTAKGKEITEMSASIADFSEPNAGEYMPLDGSKFLSGDSTKYTVEYFLSWSCSDGVYEEDATLKTEFQANETYRLSVLFTPTDAYYVNPETCIVTICGKKAAYNDQCKPKNVPCYYYYVDYTLISDSDFTFTDVKDSDYFYQPVRWAKANLITKGKSGLEFGPNDVCTRAQIVTFLWRAYGSPEPSAEVNPFTDVRAKDYFYKPVLWAVEKGITEGTSATTFSPDDTCTRAQICTFIWRAAGKEKPTQFATALNDLDKDSYFYQAVLWAVEKGITNGTSKSTFSPADGCTRGQSVTFLYRKAFPVTDPEDN